MTRFIDEYNEYVAEGGDILAVDGGDISYTRNELDEVASKVYSYLDSNGIGTEDFVQIVMPRSAKIIASIVGVIKNGSAFMLLEDTYPSDRIEYIYKDCGCKLRIDEKLFDEIIKTNEPLFGHKDAGVHDAAYAVYTSGSTGNPKGVLHEYGNLDQTLESSKANYLADIQNSCLYAPFYFIAGIMDFVSCVVNRLTMYILPHHLMRDFEGLKKYIADNNIEKIYMPPSLLRIYKNPSESLKVITTGSEPANGLTYNDRPRLINVYGMSEAGFYILSKSLSESYDVAPVGKPVLESIGVRLISDEGEVIDGVGEGEVCFVNEYVRGYINLQRQTEKAWRDGLYHTNDLGRRDENGDYYIIGRYDDMIKINGNRVEPVEIETQVKRLTGLTRIVAKGFVDVNRSYIVLYYINEEAENKGVLKNGQLVIDKDILSKCLPDYMIPTYYVGLDDFPITPTGKVSRRLLEAPDAAQYKREYEAPQSESERKLCDIMAQILGLDRVSVTDDFYDIGGDSMRAMAFVSACNEADINVTSQALFDYRTPRELAKMCGKFVGLDEIDKINNEALNDRWPLMPSQKANIAFGWRDEEHNSFNLLTLCRLRPDVDIDRLSDAATRVLSAHPGMHIRLIKEDNYYQQYNGSYRPEVEIIDIDEQEFRDSVATIDKPYNIYKDRLYRCNIYRTNKANYFYLNIHHVISDGTSRRLLLDQIAKAYNDDNYEIPKDYFFYVLSSRMKGTRTEKELPDNSKAHILNMDRQGKGHDGAAVYRPDIAPVDDKRDGSFFATSLAIAVARYNQRSDVRIKEVFSGRNELYTKDIAGELAVSASVDVEVKPSKSFEEIRHEIRMQELFEVAHPVTSFVVDTKGTSGIRFNYQKGTMDKGDFDELCDENLVKEARSTKMNGTFSLNIIETGKKDTVDAVMAYNTTMYNESSIIKLMDMFEDIVKENLK